MTLDLTKPIRHKKSKDEYIFLHKLETNSEYNIILIGHKDDGGEMCFVFPESSLENMPESRWLNVYVGTEGNVSPLWFYNPQDAEKSRRLVRGLRCVAVIEDKQDGSPWILHQL